jgi:hypothetical protein
MVQTKMGRVFFALYRNTKDDATRAVDDPVGVFSCLEWAAQYLDIHTKSFTGVITVKRKAGTRTLVRADGSSLTAREGSSDGGSSGGTVSNAVETEIAKQFRPGSKSVKLMTGKNIPNKTTKHTLFFSFPSWATIPVIADALGELLPDSKVSSTPGDTEIYPYFWIPGGGRYGILSKTAADSSTDASTDATTVAQQITAQGGTVKEGKK